jgi:hypothetical protein
VLGVTGVIGVYNGVTEWKDAVTPLQKCVTAGVILYGVLGIPGAVGLILRKRWTLPVVLLWGVIVTFVPGAAVLAYAPDGTWGAALPASISAALVAAGVAWATRTVTRPDMLDVAR